MEEMFIRRLLNNWIDHCGICHRYGIKLRPIRIPLEIVGASVTQMTDAIERVCHLLRDGARHCGARPRRYSLFFPPRLCHSPDTFDKDFVRRWVSARCDPYRDPIPEIPQDVLVQAALVYIQAFEKITGKAFALPDLSVPPLERIRANLAKFIR